MKRVKCMAVVMIIMMLNHPLTVFANDIPENVWNLAVKYGTEHNIDPYYICAIAFRESTYRSIKDPTGTYWGLMQIYPKCHIDRMARLGVTDLMDMEQNMKVATDYLAELFEEYEDPALVLMKYHGESEKNINNYIQTGEMSKYVSSILAHAEALAEEDNE